MMILIRSCSILALVAASSRLTAQSAPAVHQLGPILATSTEPLASVSQVRALPGGGVIVNDNTGRRVIMFDSTFQHSMVIADSTSATGNAYSSRLGGLIAYRGDSSLFADPSNLLLLLIDAKGKIVRTLAPPQANQMNGLIGGPFGTPGVDAGGRLVFRAPIAPQAPRSPSEPPPSPDSALIVRFDFVSRALDTVAKWRIPVVHRVLTNTVVNGRNLMMVSAMVDPIPWTDDWAILSDGTIAVIRGRDYRVDFIDGNGKMTSAPKLPFEWQRLTDDDKSAILDSVRTETEKVRAASAKRDSLASAASGRAGSLTSGPPLQFVSINDMPDYRPAFRQGSARGDADGNLWIRTSKVFKGGTVYDVINKKGALTDRVQVPPGRVIAGFGPGGVVYMGVVDGEITRLERARVH
jgi:hypothetical protein